jgi:hypothetical protein
MYIKKLHFVDIASIHVLSKVGNDAQLLVQSGSEEEILWSDP